MVHDISLRKIFDSRGEETVECEIKTSAGVFHASVPAGKSTGSREVVALDFEKAKKAFEGARKRLIEKNFSSVREFDEALRAEDGTEQKTKLGGNVMLGLSMAYARARAAEKGVSLWLLLRREFFPKANDTRKPSLFSNFINGGAHAKSGLDVQEYMVVMRPGKNYTADISTLISLYRALGTTLSKRTQGVLPVGDESGYAVSFANNFEPIEVLGKLITSAKLGSRASVALDVAASSCMKKSKYRFDGKDISGDELLGVYTEWMKKAKYLCSIEDPFHEDDAEHFAALMKKTKGQWVVGDDLTTTDSARIREMGAMKAINAVIIKPNQIGTVSEACDAINDARAEEMRVIISHRSGETEDPFIISLARASAADGVKIGAPARERMAKFNELIRLYES
jgi:enolase